MFSNRYDDFIASTSLGFNPRTQLLEFQSKNLEEAEIRGLELRGEAYLSDSLMMRWSYARIDGVEIFEDAAVPALAEETQLGEIAPNEGVVGLRYVHPSGRWGSELSVRLVESYQHGAADQFAPEAYQVVDVVGFVSLAESLKFRIGLLNLTDSKYFEWWNVRGRQADDPVIDRYSSPGVRTLTEITLPCAKRAKP